MVCQIMEISQGSIGDPAGISRTIDRFGFLSQCFNQFVIRAKHVGLRLMSNGNPGGSALELLINRAQDRKKQKIALKRFY